MSSATPVPRPAMAESRLPSWALRWPWLLVGWFLVGFVVWGCLTPAPPDLEFGLQLPQFDKLEHCGAYLLMTSWFAAALPGRGWLVFLVLVFAALGGLIEILQYLTGWRDGDWWDWAADCLGVALAIGYPTRWLRALYQRYMTHAAAG
jgi:VanZ family protein